ncbi:MAG: hypothetical protein IPG56_02225 [Caulobacteraceae bacterium]|nr:hypothetical protein [Caulobacteraceae bacterium]
MAQSPLNLLARLKLPGVVGDSVEASEVAPLIGVADARHEGGELFLRDDFCCGRHPGRLIDALRVSAAEIFYQLQHLRFGFWREVTLHVELANRFAHRVVDHIDGALPAFLLFWLAVQRAAKEGKVRVIDRAWEYTALLLIRL